MGDLEYYRPGENVRRSGLYRVYHDAHRLMHVVTLLVGDLFPCCKQCGESVRFELLRTVKDAEIIPFGSGEILESWNPAADRVDEASRK